MKYLKDILYQIKMKMNLEDKNMNIKELKKLDEIFQHYLEYNDNDEDGRDLYHKLLSPLEYEIIKRK